MQFNKNSTFEVLLLQTKHDKTFCSCQIFHIFSPCQFIPARQRQNDETTLSFLRICAAGCKFCIFPSTRTGSRALKAHLNLEKKSKANIFLSDKGLSNKGKAGRQAN